LHLISCMHAMLKYVMAGVFVDELWWHFDFICMLCACGIEFIIWAKPLLDFKYWKCRWSSRRSSRPPIRQKYVLTLLISLFQRCCRTHY
jgi:hypothetical protein